jgi:hypothetical protein
MRLESMEDHVSDGQFTYVKIHGSVDWGRPIKTKLNAPMTDDTPLIAEIVSRASSLELGGYERSGALPIAKIGDTVLFPAIAIPLERKLDFECPKEQLDALENALARATKLLVVGWRATDTPFINLLRDRLPQGVRAYVVAANEGEARQIVDRLNNGINFNGVDHFAGEGFTDFIVRRAGETFLSS